MRGSACKRYAVNNNLNAIHNVLCAIVESGLDAHLAHLDGTGGQTRAFIHIRDTVKCIKLAIENPPLPGERVKIFNQATETWSVKELAALVSRLTGCEVRSYAKPRKEDQENDLLVETASFAAWA